MYKKYFKRTIELLASVIGLLLLLPVLVGVTFLLTLANKGKPFFFQSRPGLNEKLFNIIKFKTMTDAKNKNGKFLPDSERLTSLGKFIRKISVDELPQLINVLKGDMSLIGPRPLLSDYLPLYSKYHRRRHELKPGITGWAQVNGRQSIKLSKRRDLDIWYVDNVSLKVDILIIFKTVNYVFSGKGIRSGQGIAAVDDLEFSEKLKEKSDEF
jgi:undecaprenyl phosphate N,N'-diacetylbacillosamine 1-phosphate transferase